MAKKVDFKEAGKRIIEEFKRERELHKGEPTTAEILLNMDAGKGRDRVNALLYVLALLLEKESEDYKKLNVQLSYDYIPFGGSFHNVILADIKTSETERKTLQLAFDNEADFLEVLAKLLTELDGAAKEYLKK